MIKNKLSTWASQPINWAPLYSDHLDTNSCIDERGLPRNLSVSTEERQCDVVELQSSTLEQGRHKWSNALNPRPATRWLRSTAKSVWVWATIWSFKIHSHRPRDGDGDGETERRRQGKASWWKWGARWWIKWTTHISSISCPSPIRLLIVTPSIFRDCSFISYLFLEL